MSRKERDRLKVLSQVSLGGLSVKLGAELLKLSYRQMCRLLARYKADGDVGIIHKGRGRVSNHRIANEKKEQILALMAENFADFGPTLASEQLLERHDLAVSRETLRNWLIEAGLWHPRRRRVKHRSWRERRACYGELVQMDSSEHDWLEGRGEKLYLIALIDDATSRLMARFYTSDSTFSNMDLLRSYIKRNGRPISLYTDKASHFVCGNVESIDDQLLGRRARTQIGRALEELGIELILAHSPQAKGRVERLFGTLQDRLVKLMRQEGINDMEAANRYLSERFIPDWNRRFTHTASSAVNAHRSSSGYDLGAIFSRQESRKVTNDYTVSYKGLRYQIDKRSAEPGLRNGRVLVEERLNGQVKISFRQKYLKIKALPPAASAGRARMSQGALPGGGMSSGEAERSLSSSRHQAARLETSWRVRLRLLAATPLFSNISGES